MSSVVQSFVNGATEGEDGKYSISNNKLFSYEGAIAFRTKDSFIIADKMPVDVSDSLIFNIAKSGKDFVRQNLSVLSSPEKRVKEIEDGSVNDFKAVANFYGFSYTEEEINSAIVLSTFKARIQAFFKEIEAKEAEELRIQMEKNKSERERKETEKWDGGSGNARNSTVKGAGGGLRLRRRLSGSRDYCETSGGERTTMSVARKAWNFACQYWYGDKEFGRYNQNATKKLTSGSYYNSGRSATVTETHLAIGCQKVTKAEAERFAAVHGWPKAGAV